MSNYGYNKADENYHHYEQTSDKLWLIFGITVMGIGTVGHLLALFVIIGNRRMRLLSISMYIIASSLAGLGALYVGLLRQILMRINDHGDIRSRLSDAGCRLHAAVTYYCLQLFAGLQASMAVERVIAVWRPMHYERWCTRLRSAITVVTVATTLAAFNIIVIASFGKDENGDCRASDDEYYFFLFDTVWGWLDCVLYSILPGAIIIPCSCVTIFLMLASRKSAQVSNNSRKSRRFTIMLLVHNAVFVITTLPISVVFLLPRHESENDADRGAYNLAWVICSLLQYCGTSLGFFVYSTVEEKFRQATIELFRKGFNAEVSSERSGNSVRNLQHCEIDNNFIPLRTLNASTAISLVHGASGSNTAPEEHVNITI